LLWTKWGRLRQKITNSSGPKREGGGKKEGTDKHGEGAKKKTETGKTLHKATEDGHVDPRRAGKREHLDKHVKETQKNENANPNRGVGTTTWPRGQRRLREDENQKVTVIEQRDIGREEGKR